MFAFKDLALAGKIVLLQQAQGLNTTLVCNVVRVAVITPLQQVQRCTQVSF